MRNNKKDSLVILVVSFCLTLSGLISFVYVLNSEQVAVKKKEEQLDKYDKKEKAAKLKASEQTKKIEDQNEKARVKRELNAIPKDKDQIVGKLSIKSADINEPVYAGDATKSQLKKGLAFAEKDENMLDQNVSIAGHTYANGPKKDFTKLNETNKGDIVKLSVKGSTYKYKITGHQSVKPDETSVLDDNKNSKQILTLVTCDDYDKKTNKWLTRLVYTAKRVS